MNRVLKLLCLVLVLVDSISVFGGCPFEAYTDVVTACVGVNDLGVTFPAGSSDKEVTSFPVRANENVSKGYTHGIGCLDRTPSPAWFAIRIDEPGNLLLNISHSGGTDIDFACWGPFPGKTKQAMLENVCAQSDTYFSDFIVPNTINSCRLEQMEQCESRFAVDAKASAIDKITSKEKISECKAEVDRRSKIDTEYECFFGNHDAFPIAYMADCSFSSSANEPCFIANAKKGDWYIFLVTNFAGAEGDINFTKVDGSATTDCSVIVDAWSNSPVCEGDSMKLWLNNMPAFATCHWTGPNGFESTEIAPVIPSASKRDAGTYYVSITTHDGFQSDDVAVTVDVVANAPVDTTLRVVQGDVVKFKGKEYSKAGEYEQFIKYGQCNKRFNVKVVEMPLLPAYIEHNGPLCEGDSLVLSIGDVPDSEVSGYEWSGPNGFHSTLKSVSVPKMNAKKAGRYSLKIKKDGLTYPIAPVEVQVIEKVKEKVTKRIVIGESYEFEGELLTKQGRYTSNHQSDYGCDSTIELTLLVEIPEFVPNILVTPNGDGENDVWTIKNIEYCPEAIVRLYDRYGKVVYETAGYNSENAWNGKDKIGRDLPTADYWYTIDVQSADRVYYGHVTLMR